VRVRISGILVGAVLLGCTDPVGPSPALSAEDQLALQIVPHLEWRTGADHPATITSAQVERQTLHLMVEYGGGCATHRFALVAGTELGESLPPYTVLRLAHDGNGDPCRALLGKQLEVDLSPILPLVNQSGGSALRFILVEPGERVSTMGELLVTF